MIGAALAMNSAAAATDVELVSGRAFGTGWQIVAPLGAGIARLVPDIEALFDDIDRRLSPWRADSAVSRFNTGPARIHARDPALAVVTAAALEIARQSKGAFDPTVGPLVARWGFGPINHGGEPDWEAIGVGPHGVTKDRADLTLDLCGIAKGWALDRAARLLQGAGVQDALLDLGGELIALGSHPDGREWQVAVASPIASGPVVGALRLPRGRAVATSGVREQSYVLNPRRYSHIIDPATHEPARGGLVSVTVVAPDAMAADGWATALFAAGGVAGPRLALAEGIDALFLSEARGGLRQVATGRISEFML
ncbi:FAD:protein FMN transferase [Aestuariicoccus sp. MJ-SS9]|uniref:FAD:protein FMN transferase n=1 Tax=Aestuariicoccus sp. MJ-SS9 TaxID=3079855 RepID=UPI0029088062|nr:FAD:protein FMN transferase [Aestuariicoccus sp. MJ-SS9]MDU8913063.1 FAD:protein FMN transferase [Aestuariicoccus sp. MJ-SS9]